MTWITDDCIDLLKERRNSRVFQSVQIFEQKAVTNSPSKPPTSSVNQQRLSKRNTIHEGNITEMQNNMKQLLEEERQKMLKEQEEAQKKGILPIPPAKPDPANRNSRSLRAATVSRAVNTKELFSPALNSMPDITKERSQSVTPKMKEIPMPAHPPPKLPNEPQKRPIGTSQSSLRILDYLSYG
jgi:hypothetical protein